MSITVQAMNLKTLTLKIDKNDFLGFDDFYFTINSTLRNKPLLSPSGRERQQFHPPPPPAKAPPRPPATEPAPPHPTTYTPLPAPGTTNRPPTPAPRNETKFLLE